MEMNHEHAVLGAAFLDASLIPIICGDLDAEDFCSPQTSSVFVAINTLYKAENPIDIVTVSEELEKTGDLERIGGVSFLFSLIEFTPTTANTRAYIDRLHESRKRKTFARGMREAIEQAESGEPNYIEIADGTIQSVNSVGSVNITPISDVIPTVLNRLGDNTRGISSGFYTMDYVSGGFRKGSLIIVAARPGVGKTAFACNMAAKMAKEGLVVPFFSLEMPQEEITERIMLSEAMVDKYDAIRGGTAMQAVVDIQEKIDKWKILIDDRPSIAIGQIQSSCHKIKQREKRLDCVFIDYLQLMKTSGNKNFKKNDLVGENSRLAKIMARELKCPVVLLCQLNREADGVEPTMAMLRDSGEIEQNADMVILIHRAANQPNSSTIIIGKNRHGRTGKIDFVWKPEYTRFMEQTFTEVDVPKGIFND